MIFNSKHQNDFLALVDNPKNLTVAGVFARQLGATYLCGEICGRAALKFFSRGGKKGRILYIYADRLPQSFFEGVAASSLNFPRLRKLKYSILYALGWRGAHINTANSLQRLSAFKGLSFDLVVMDNAERIAAIGFSDATAFTIFNGKFVAVGSGTIYTKESFDQKLPPVPFMQFIASADAKMHVPLPYDALSVAVLPELLVKTAYDAEFVEFIEGNGKDRGVV